MSSFPFSRGNRPPGSDFHCAPEHGACFVTGLPTAGRYRERVRSGACSRRDCAPRPTARPRQGPRPRSLRTSSSSVSLPVSCLTLRFPRSGAAGLGSTGGGGLENSVLSNRQGRRMSKRPKHPAAGLILRGSPGKPSVPMFTTHLRGARPRCVTLKAFEQV